ncbi:gamma-aminobutyric acid receptor subunit beta-like [Ruditapes philippinarum]|uniref:gamma-aminobutyric acid receptor subunit beta-like n=1 Tax=Ruditapes philippinarum TaxID=129788 RepID=UPI00295B9202|nr:gamma-aminobutyric acid receptor subunit beta-like [Ruditapes philippinarum]
MDVKVMRNCTRNVGLRHRSMAINTVVNFIFITVLMMCLTKIVDCYYIQSNISKHDLLEALLNPNRYDPSIPPEYITEEGATTKVKIQLTIHDFISENEKNMEFSCLMYVRMYWTDSRLDYSNNASYSNLKVSGSFISKVWVPDIFFTQNRQSYFTGVIGKNELIYIGRYGNITFSGRYV